jgi:hypothetical protein
MGGEKGQSTLELIITIGVTTSLSFWLFHILERAVTREREYQKTFTLCRERWVREGRNASSSYSDPRPLVCQFRMGRSSSATITSRHRRPKPNGYLQSPGFSKEKVDASVDRGNE